VISLLVLVIYYRNGTQPKDCHLGHAFTKSGAPMQSPLGFHFLFRPSFVFCQCLLSLQPILTATTKVDVAATNTTHPEINFPFCMHFGGLRFGLCFVPMMRWTTRMIPTNSDTAISSTIASSTSIGCGTMLLVIIRIKTITFGPGDKGIATFLSRLATCFLVMFHLFIRIRWLMKGVRCAVIASAIVVAVGTTTYIQRPVLAMNLPLDERNYTVSSTNPIFFVVPKPA
jgi:hypothetical protein